MRELGRSLKVRVSNALLRTLSRGAITGEAQPNVHFRKMWKLCRGWIREGTPGGRAVEGSYNVVVWTKAEGKERGCGFKRGYGRDR